MTVVTINVNLIRINVITLCLSHDFPVCEKETMKTGISTTEGHSVVPTDYQGECSSDDSIGINSAHDVDNNFDCDILTPKQVAQYLQMSPRTVYSHWEKLGGLKVGRTLRFRKENIDALFGEESKKMERGGQKRKPKVYATFPDENGSKELGSRTVEGAGKPEAAKDRNRHGLVDGQ